MYRTKQAVDKHVAEILGKIQNQNEKHLRGYNFARLYFGVKENESAKKYLLGYLSVREHHAPSHKLMAQVFEAENERVKALQSYKRSLELDPTQKDIVLKICALYTQVPVDPETAKYWADRAERYYPHHDIVFRLKETIMTLNGEPDREELERLILKESASQPNLSLEIKLLRLYMDTDRIKQAYVRAVKVETKRLFLTNVEWYNALTEVFEVYQEQYSQELDYNFYLQFLTALDHLVVLELRESHNNGPSNKSLQAAVVLQQFDHYLKKASEKEFPNNGAWLFFLQHMKGQLFMHLSCLAIERATKEQGHWKETARVSAALFLVAYGFRPSNLLQESWFMQMDEQQKVYTRIFHQGAMRTSFVGHSAISLCGDEDSVKWLQKNMLEVCIPQVRERVYNKLFESNTKKNIHSCFLSDPAYVDAVLEMPTLPGLLEYDRSLYKVCPENLHNLIWLNLHQTNSALQSSLHEAFKGLQYHNSNLSRGAPESLCLLDIDAYLIAVLYTTSLFLEQRTSLYTHLQAHPLSMPPTISDQLCTDDQSHWWNAAHSSVNRTSKERYGEQRKILQRGLEVIRGIGNHGLEIQLVVHLARAFGDKALAVHEDLDSSHRLNNDNARVVNGEKSDLEFRAVHYWNLALGMLETLASNKTLRVPRDRMFFGYCQDLSPEEVQSLMDEGKLYVACRLMDQGKLEEAAEHLEKLTTPYACYYLGLIFKRLSIKENSKLRTALLHKARDALYRAMDACKGDSSSSLNGDILIELEEIEDVLGGQFSFTHANNSEINDCSTPLRNHSKYMTPLGSTSSIQSTPKPSSVFMSGRKTESIYQRTNHLEPSPERLDAQIRTLAMTQSTIVKTLIEQQRSLLETNNAIIEELKRNKEFIGELKQSLLETNNAVLEGLKQNRDVFKDLSKQLENLQISSQKPHSKDIAKKPSTSKSHGDEEDEFNNFETNDYLDYYVENTVDGYHHQQPGYNYNPSRVLDRVGAPNVAYRPPPPPMTHYGYYPSTALPPPGAIPESPHYYQTLNHGLPFSEGQHLPQFQFHVGSSIGKTPVLNNVASLAQPITSMPLVPPSQMQSSWAKSGSVPHAFQIPLPAANVDAGISQQQPTVLATPSPYIPSMVNSVGQSTPSATKTMEFSFSNRTPEQNVSSRSRLDSDVYSDTELEREVMGDFKPVIPLPAEIIVETGEEEELVLFEDRAKLFRFVEHEWKERGIGNVKILKHDNGRIRLLMRRDQVHKVCANHLFQSSMVITYMKESEKALTWAAQDFADETVKPEQFCIRFKTVNIAAAFKKAFEDAVDYATANEKGKPYSTPEKPSTTPAAPPSAVSGFGAKFLPKAGSWSCPTCYVSNSSSKSSCVACETKKPDSPAAKSAEIPMSSTAKSPFTFTTNLSSPSAGMLTFGGVSLVNQNSAINANQTTQVTKVSTNSESPLNLTKAADGLALKPIGKSVLGNFSFSLPPSTADLGKTETKTEVSSSKEGGLLKSALTSGFSFAMPPSMFNTDTKFGDKPLSTVGGFTFNAVPVVAEEIDIKDRDILVVSTKSKDGPQVTKVEASDSPFSHFSFKTPSDSGKTSNANEKDSKSPFSAFFIKDTTPSFGAKSPSSATTSTEVVLNQPIFGSASGFSNLGYTPALAPKTPDTGSKLSSGSPLFVTIGKDGRRVSGEMGGESAPDEFIPTAEFEPVVPLPALVEAKTGEEDCDKLFGERVRLYRYDVDTKQWKERGTGEMKILKERDGKFRILMRREQVLKICANHYILPEMKLSPLASNSKSWVWLAQDFSEMSLQQEQFAARFKNATIASEFQMIFENCLSELLKQKDEDATNPSTFVAKDMAVKKDPCAGNSSSFGEQFKLSANDWVCEACYVKNSINVDRCLSCETPNPTPVEKWRCASCHTENHNIYSTCLNCNSQRKQSATGESSTNVLKTLSEMFKPDPSSWECGMCYVRNTGTDYCVSCETPKPGCLPKPAPSVYGGFTFSKPFSSSGFVFGSKSSDVSATFQFGTGSTTIGFTPNIDSKTSGEPAVFRGKPTTFGGGTSSIPAVTTAPAFVFGKPSAVAASQPIPTPSSAFSFSNDPQSDASESEFKFGSPQKYEFNFTGVRPQSPSKSVKSPKSPGVLTDEDDEEVVQSDVDNIYFQPVIPLPPKVDVKTGEEEESVLFTKRAKLFRFVEGEWKERGIGDIKILHNPNQKSVRLLMRRDQVLKVCLNHKLTDDIKFVWKSDKSLSWAAMDYSENSANLEQFAIRFKQAESANEFFEAINLSLQILNSPEAFTRSKSTTPVRQNLSSKFEGTPERGPDVSGQEGSPTSYSDTLSSFSFSLDKSKNEGHPNAFSLASRFGTSSTSNQSSAFFNRTVDSAGADDDVSVLCEVKATPEQVAAAEKLMLPPNFYLYEQSPPCPGCRGCDDYDKSKIGTQVSQEATLVQKVDTVIDSQDQPNSESSNELFTNSSLSLFSFADVVPKTSGFGSLAAPKSIFPGAGAPVFGQQSQLSQSQNEDDGEVVQCADIHFEPVIPLPDIIEVKTGEEDEIVMFCNRAKLYRFDNPTKQWKERGVGDLKILEHKHTGRFRLLHRREQVHKVSCNHAISPQMELKPMSTSENSLCWTAVDFSDGHAESSQFAIRFKNSEILTRFKLLFEHARNTVALVENVDITAAVEQKAVVKDIVPDSMLNPVTIEGEASGVTYERDSSETEGDDDEEDEDDSDDSDDADQLVYKDCVTFEVFNDRCQRYEVIGRGMLKIVFDDDVFGYRIKVIANDELLSDHIIAIQTCLHTSGLKAAWSALDISLEPPLKRKFQSTFETVDSVKLFAQKFEEGKNAALQNEILEKNFDDIGSD